MINIAICDDDVAMTSIIEEMLYTIAKEQGYRINCAVFFDGSTLVENIRQGTYYDLIYLDIEMEKVDGITAAKLIRGMEIPSLIVFVSGYETYMKELFYTEPFRFLLKPIDTKEFDAVFADAYKRIRKRPEYFSFSYNKELIKIPLGRIFYFESCNRVIYVHEAGNVTAEYAGSKEVKHKLYGKMNDVERRLSASNVRFLRIHQSYLVNFDYIKSMNFTKVIMLDGTVLQISEDRQKNVRAQFCAMTGMEILGND